MLKGKVSIAVIVLCLVSLSSAVLYSAWEVEIVSYKENVIFADQGYSIIRGRATVKSDSEERTYKFLSATLDNHINLLTIKDMNGVELEPQLKYDYQTKEFYHGKRKNRVFQTIDSDSTNKEVIRSGIRVWLDMR